MLIVMNGMFYVMNGTFFVTITPGRSIAKKLLEGRLWNANCVFKAI